MNSCIIEKFGIPIPQSGIYFEFIDSNYWERSFYFPCEGRQCMLFVRRKIVHAIRTNLLCMDRVEYLIIMQKITQVINNTLWVFFSRTVIFFSRSHCHSGKLTHLGENSASCHPRQNTCGCVHSLGQQLLLKMCLEKTCGNQT